MSKLKQAMGIFSLSFLLIVMWPEPSPKRHISRGIASEGGNTSSPFQRYGDEFESLAKQYGKLTYRYLIRFGKPELPGYSSQIYAVCNPVGDRHEITVDREAWNNMSELCRKALIFHEAGHCGLGLVHGPGIMRDTLNCEAAANPKEIERLFN